MNLIFCKLKRGKNVFVWFSQIWYWKKNRKIFFFAFSVSELKKDLVIHYILPCKYYSANIKYKKYNKYVLFSSYITSYIELQNHTSQRFNKYLFLKKNSNKIRLLKSGSQLPPIRLKSVRGKLNIFEDFSSFCTQISSNKQKKIEEKK